MNTQDEEREKKPNKGNGWYYGRLYPGICTVLVGLIFLLNEFGYLKGQAWGKLWPLFIIIPGLFMIFSTRRSC
jgi:hypothetical protein